MNIHSVKMHLFRTNITIALLSLLMASPFLASAQDSTAVYTLKENERIVYLTENRLLATNTSVGHLLFLQRPSGYFILFNSKEFGPHQNIQFSESNVCLLDWAVFQNGKWYQLILDKGLQFGPYDNVVDVYRSDGYRINKSLADEHYGFRATRGGKSFAVVDGKEYGPFKDELPFGTPKFIEDNGSLRVCFKYDDSYDNATGESKDWCIGDSIVLATTSKTPSLFSVVKTTLYKDNTLVVQHLANDGYPYALGTFRQSKNGAHSLSIDTAQVVYFDGKIIANAKAVVGKYNAVEGDFGFIFNSDVYYYISRTSDGYFVNVSNRKTAIGPFAFVPSVEFSEDASHMLIASGPVITIDNTYTIKNGFSPVYNTGTKGFSWLSVSGRTIYLHQYKP